MKIVYIDMQNIHKSTVEQWRIIDRWLFLKYLHEKFLIDQAIMFVGYIQKYKHFYDKLTGVWYMLVFKEVLVRKDGTIKWDVDIDIAIHAMKHISDNNISEAYLVTGDADYNSLINEWTKIEKFGKLLVPNLNKTLYILRKAAGWKLQPLSDIKHRIEKKQKD